MSVDPPIGDDNTTSTDKIMRVIDGNDLPLIESESNSSPRYRGFTFTLSSQVSALDCPVVGLGLSHMLTILWDFSHPFFNLKGQTLRKKPFSLADDTKATLCLERNNNNKK